MGVDGGQEKPFAGSEKGFNQEEGDLETAMGLIQSTGALAKARNEAVMWADRARNALASLPDNATRTAMQDLADFVVSRVS